MLGCFTGKSSIGSALQGRHYPAHPDETDGD